MSAEGQYMAFTRFRSQYNQCPVHKTDAVLAISFTLLMHSVVRSALLAEMTGGGCCDHSQDN